MAEFADVVGAEAVFARHEHDELRDGLDQLMVAARAVMSTACPDIAPRVRPIEVWLTKVLIPHVVWERAVIFPEVDDLSGNVWPTAVMAFDHMQIERAARVIEREVVDLSGRTATSDDRAQVYEHVIGLEALIRAHLEREDEFLLPILDGQFPRTRPS
jgi:hemerythrin-like domain-containing protein